ncbi:MAG: glycoside hydrolase family 3 C-terminal domain-containing protein, partial [Acidobacteriaceae bacterium]|nr:glycoside hydrolase family 3 C-terminal domain-containing protein [Acidobacteriaceae bacterium]
MKFVRPLLFAVAVSHLVGAVPPAKKTAPRSVTALRPSAGQSAIAERWLRSLNLHDRIAQLIVMPCYGEAINVRSKQFRNYQHLIRDVHVGGMIVLGHYIYGTIKNAEPYAMAALFNRFQTMSTIPLLIGADFERGASMRVDSTTPWPYNMAFAAAQDTEASRLEGAATAKEARALGVNWIFAPDADVNNNPDNPIINIRAYSENAGEVASHVQAYVQGARLNLKSPILVTVKHFPGHGDTSIDSHLSLPKLEAPKERIESVELTPFKAAISEGVDAVMTAHMAVPALDPDGVPATVSSKILTDLLRNELHFRGLIVTDAMNMQGLTQMFDTGEAAVRSLEAGADVLLMPVKAEDAIAGVMAAVRSGRLTKARIDQSALKVLQAKARLGLARSKIVNLHGIGETIDAPEDNEVAQRVAEHAITLVKDERDSLPLRKADNTSLLILTENRSGHQGRRLMEEVKKRAPNINVVLLDAQMSKADMDAAVKTTDGAGSVIVAAFVTVGANRGNVALGGEYPGLMDALLAPGRPPVMLAALGSPYLLRTYPDVKTYLTTCSTGALSETALAKALLGEIPIAGHLPVTIPGLAKYGAGIRVPAA